MENFIGKTLEKVVSLLDKSNEKYVIKDNNHNVEGEICLVTNAQRQDDIIVLTTGKFIFDVKGNSNAKKN